MAKKRKLTPFPLGPMPAPSKLSAEQAEQVIAWFATLPHEELRYRQSLCIAQMSTAAKSLSPLAVEGHENMFIVWKQLAAAVGRKSCLV